jgi:hypothetical protein
VPENEMILNWSNNLRKTNDGLRYVAAQTAQAYKADGFNASETFELMVADDFDIDVTKEILSQVFESEKIASAPEPTRFAMVVPTSYKDVVPLIEDALVKLSPNQFVESLFNKLIISSRKDKESWKRLAQQAVNDPVAKKILHEDLRPWIEETMLNSVLAAEQQQYRVAALDGELKEYAVSTNSGNVKVNLQDGVCSCERFQNGHFASFGLACEHMVRVADTISPFERLTRALKNK